MLGFCLLNSEEKGSLKCNLPSCPAFGFPLRILEALKIGQFRLNQKLQACLGLDLDTSTIASFVIVGLPYLGPSSLAVTASTTQSSTAGPPFPMRPSSLIPAFAVDPFHPCPREAAFPSQAVALAISRHRQRPQLDWQRHLH